MRLAQASSVRSEPVVSGGCEFLSPTARTARCQQLAEEGFLVARVVPQFIKGESQPMGPLRPNGLLGPGGLREALEGAVELSLALRGAVPPTVDVRAEATEIARDQLFRVRALDGRGLCLVLPSLEGITLEDGVLHAADGKALAVWQRLCVSDPVVMLFEETDRDVQVLAPQPLWTMLVDCLLTPDDPVDLLLHDGRTPTTFDEHMGASPAAPPLRTTDPGFLLDERQLAEIRARIDEGLRDSGTGSIASVASRDGFETLAALDSQEAASHSNSESLLREDPLDGLGLEGLGLDEDAFDDTPDSSAFTLSPVPEAPRTQPMQPSLFDGPDGDPVMAALISEPSAASLVATAEALAADSVAEPSRPSLVDSVAQAHAPSPTRQPLLTYEAATAFATELEEANGPKPVRAIEKLYCTRYAPLLEALNDGMDHVLAEEVVQEWGESFERSYTDAYKALKITGKRPTMVLDAPDVAARIARLNGARTVQLLLVDGMRYDLGQRVMRQLRERIGDQAACVEETLLWSALPTSTPAQLRLLSRGPAGLREPEPESDREALVHRGKSVSTLRRVRIGRRDLVKLDVVEARLREAGEGFVPRMDALADEVGEIIAHYAESLAPRTLLYVFGDHGFQLSAESAEATGAANQGGASPEEVLVGGQAWLVGDVH